MNKTELDLIDISQPERVNEPTATRAKFAKFANVGNKVSTWYKKVNKPILYIAVIIIFVTVYAYTVIRTPFIYNDNTDINGESAVRVSKRVSMETVVSMVEKTPETPNSNPNDSTTGDNTGDNNDSGDTTGDNTQPTPNPNPQDNIPGVINTGEGNDMSVTNAQYVINYLMSKGGYSRDAAIGFAANIEVESHFDPTVGSGHKGLCQWDSGRWSNYQSYLSQNGKQDCVNSQLDFLIDECRGANGAHAQYPEHTGPDALNTCQGKFHATKIVAKFFERCPNGNVTIPATDNSYPDANFAAKAQGGGGRLDAANAMN